MTDIEREVYNEVIMDLIKIDEKGEFYIEEYKFNRLYISPENKKVLLEELKELGVNIKQVKPRRIVTDELESVLDVNKPSGEIPRVLLITNQIKNRLERELNRKPSARELSREMGISEERANMFMHQLLTRENLVNYSVVDDLYGTDIPANLVGEESYSTDETTLHSYRNEVREKIELILETKCTDLERLVFRRFFGIDGYEKTTLTDISKDLSIKRSIVNKAKNKAVDKMRFILKQNNFESYLYEVNEVAGVKNRL